MSDVKGKTGAVLRETAVLTGAVAISAAGFFFFLVPSHTSVSSISGLGIVLSNFVPLPLSVSSSALPSLSSTWVSPLMVRPPTVARMTLFVTKA